MIAVTIELKLLSIITISEASLAISVPANIANPTSDFDKAGASFVPSPVTATTFFKVLRPKTKAYLCNGCERAITFNLSVIILKFFIFFITSFFIGLNTSSLFFFCISFASASVFGHVHEFVSFLHSLQINPPIQL